MSKRLLKRCLKIPQQKGVSLIVVLLILVVVSILGAGAIQLTTLGERSARNDRDYQIAWQAAEAGLIDAELDLNSKVTGTRSSLFGRNSTNTVNVNDFAASCGTSDNKRGLCAGAVATGTTPAWLVVDFTSTSESAATTRFGQFTNRTFPYGSVGIQPSKPPRYVIELFDDPQDRDLSKSNDKYIFRVTAMGFGPRDDIQGVVQMLYRN